MTTKYWRYSLKGEHRASSIHSVPGVTISHGLVVRIHSQRGKTHIYVAGEPPLKTGRSRSRNALVPVEVSEEEATTLRFT